MGILIGKIMKNPLELGAPGHRFSDLPTVPCHEKTMKTVTKTAPASVKLERLANLRPVPTGVSDILKSSRYGRVPVS